MNFFDFDLCFMVLIFIIFYFIIYSFVSSIECILFNLICEGYIIFK